MDQKALSVEEAQDVILSHVQKLETERVQLSHAFGRTLAREIKSAIDVCSFDNAAMDGFALRRDDLNLASKDSPVELSVICDIAAGDYFEGTIQNGQCARIMTGAAVPKDADAVIKYEDVDYLGGSGKSGSNVAFFDCPKQGNNIRFAGEEIRRGETILNAGEVLNAGGLGLLANCGIDKVDVIKKPKVAIISIGSELTLQGENLKLGAIYESNSYAMSACTLRAGCEPEALGIVTDNLDDLVCKIMEATKRFDLIVTTGGASNGDFDYIGSAIDKCGEVLFEEVNMRPGKCQTFGIINNIPIMGLPGNPAAAFCGFEILLRPALLKMQGKSHLFPRTVRAKLGCDLKKRDKRRLYMRANISKQSDGGFIVNPAKSQSSGLFGPIQSANCLSIVREGDCGGVVHADEMLDCIVFGIEEWAVI